MRSRVLTALLALLIFSSSAAMAEAPAAQRFSTTFFGAFDTVIILIGYAETEEAFAEAAAEARAMFERLHQVYDAYNAHDGVRNVYYMNNEAARGPVAVEPELMDLLCYFMDHEPMTEGMVNIALGAVLSLWHDARTEAEKNPEGAALPEGRALEEAAGHTRLQDLVLDPEAGTVYYADPLLRVDVGAIAKGYATERVAEMLLASAMPSFILNAGGNVRAGHAPQEASRSKWGVTLQDPNDPVDINDTRARFDILYLTDTSVVTSGDYERFFTVDGRRYHHMISPDTLMPAAFHRSVTVVCEDSGLADLLSTTLFLMPYERGAALVSSLEGVEAYWILADDTARMTEGMEAYSANMGAMPR